VSEQLPTEDLRTQTENEVICEKLLGWSKAQWFGGWAGNWDRPDGGMCAGTPSFITPNEAELLAQSLIARRLCIKMEYKPWAGKWDVIIQTQEQTIAGGRGDSWQQGLRAAVVRFLDLVAYPWPSEPRAMHELRVKLLELPA
jgi:hypothetical protein